MPLNIPSASRALHTRRDALDIVEAFSRTATESSQTVQQHPSRDSSGFQCAPTTRRSNTPNKRPHPGVVSVRPRGQPLDRDLHNLPKDCEELTATQAPDSNLHLNVHRDCLPGIEIRRAVLLPRLAADPAPAVLDDAATDAGDTVLGLEDLLRDNVKGYHTLPRVQQVVTVGGLESLLETVVERQEKRMDYSAYQYPRYVLTRYKQHSTATWPEPALLVIEDD
jgi:hypothetical protein